MDKVKIDLKAETFGEKWFETAVNNPPHKWLLIMYLVSGIAFTVFSHMRLAEHISILDYMGPMWLMLALVNFERYNARKSIERFIKSYALPSEVSHTDESNNKPNKTLHTNP